MITKLELTPLAVAFRRLASVRTTANPLLLSSGLKVLNPLYEIMYP